MEQDKSFHHNTKLLLLLFDAPWIVFSFSNMTRKVKGSPVMTTVITDGWASAAGETLLTDAHDKRGENEFTAALLSSLP